MAAKTEVFLRASSKGLSGAIARAMLFIVVSRVGAKHSVAGSSLNPTLSFLQRAAPLSAQDAADASKVKSSPKLMTW